MKTQLSILTLALALSLPAAAKNTVSYTEQVTAPVTLSTDVDYVIKGTTPFTVTGSINLTNTEHAVIIFENVRPSKALSYLSFVKINGEDAVNDENCQVKMYASGSIIMPYAKDFKPLTVYSEQNFGGESVNDFGLEHSNGYMNTLTTAKLNNRIRSFRLKRGYMVTFSNSAQGRGYNRCFIADKEDLEFAVLPPEMDKRISSYRIFKWNDAEKKGLANSTNYNDTQILNVSWCYSFGPGEDRGMDCECVPHKIEIGWPGNCGTLTYSPHLKTNNEPGNEADHGTEDLDAVLNTWEDLMATGRRLCSPSSHDGSLGWMRAFMDSIDARGWRCDIIDMHCYWPEWNLNNGLQSWWNDYKRPIWISEFVWGASWNNNGIFATDRSYSIENQQKNYDVMSKVLTNWNNTAYIERYAYWNSEADCSKILKDGKLSILGNFYATMESHIGYNKNYEFVPRVVQKAPKNINLEYTERTRKLVITWNNPNAEFTDSTLLEVRLNDGEWQTLQAYPCSEKTSYTYSVILPEDFRKGVYTYRVSNYDLDEKIRRTGEVQLSMVSAEGQPGFQYGTLKIADSNTTDTEFDAVAEESSAVFTGLTSYNNQNTVPVNTVARIQSGKFSFRAFPWNQGSYTQTFAKEESVDFMVLKMGSHSIGDITVQVGKCPQKVNNDSMWVDFETPFPEGTTPVVITNIVTRYAGHPFMTKVWHITHKGFAVKLARQAALDKTSSTFVSQDVYYVAATPGTSVMEDGKILSVGRNEEDKVDGKRIRNIYFTDTQGNHTGLYNPTIICGPQTDNYAPASVYRLQSLSVDRNDVNYLGEEAATIMRIIRQKDETDEGLEVDNVFNNGDVMGWIAISNPKVKGGDNIASVQQTHPTVRVRNGHIFVDGTDHYGIYTLSGQQIARHTRLARGIYVVKTSLGAVKVLVP